jgi:hypothetical protein
MMSTQRKINTDKKIRFTKIILLVTTCWLVVAIITGCGYTTRSVISQLYRTIYVSPFINKIDITSETSVARGYKIYHPLLENDITREVTNELILDGGLRLAKQEEADLILEGELVDYRKDALSYTDNEDEDVKEYRVSIAVDLKLYDTSNQTTLWEEDNFVGDTTYFTTGSLAKSESTAIGEAVDDLARRIIDHIVDIW